VWRHLGCKSVCVRPTTALHTLRVFTRKLHTTNPFVSSGRRCIVRAPLRRFVHEAGGGSSAGAAEGTRSWAGQSDEEIRRAILDAALAHVHARGFSIPALTQGAKDCGFESTAVLHGMFDNGGMAVLDHLCRSQTAAMVEEVSKLPLHDMTALERVQCAMKSRLEMNKPYLDIWASAMALGASPEHLATTHAHIAHTVDCMWEIAGVNSDEATTYTKKVALGAVYVSTELFMLSDQSLEHEHTWAFMDRRLNDLLNLQGLPLELASKATVGLAVLGKALQSLSPLTAAAAASAGSPQAAEIFSRATQAAAQAGEAAGEAAIAAANHTILKQHTQQTQSDPAAKP